MALIQEDFEPKASALEPIVPHFTQQYVDQWCATCDQFLRWERESILKSEPSSTDLARHRLTLKWLMRFTRVLKSMAMDPEFPHPSALEVLDMKLWQLEQSWKTLYDPLPLVEADRILAEVFPNES
jgi:hypothetical protein